MTTLSVPMPQDLIEFIDALIDAGDVENRAQAVRKAVRKLREQAEIHEIMEASLEAHSGKVYSGNIKNIIKSRKNG
jgi:Arc/MetJ-type ribon-helix-helix transcriptional regulator